MTADPVLARRARIAELVRLGQRVGYGAFLAAIVLFVVGLGIGFPGWLATLVIALMILGSAVLPPAIVFHYGLRAAEREEREQAATDERSRRRER